ncbi:MAG: VanZ family protein [Chitinophagaceae bacterium]|nr:VanZ family protein [Chitinophagaceae bacterium]
MELKQISKRLIITGTLVIWAIKFIIRPMNLFDDPTRFVLNIAPNLLGSFLIPFGAYWFFSGKNFLVARIFKIETTYDLRLVCLLGFGMLIINEYLQLIPIFGRTFDLNDILFSSFGLLAAYFVFGKLQQRYQAQVN